MDPYLTGKPDQPVTAGPFGQPLSRPRAGYQAVADTVPLSLLVTIPAAGIRERVWLARKQGVTRPSGARCKRRGGVQGPEPDRIAAVLTPARTNWRPGCRPLPTTLRHRDVDASPVTDRSAQDDTDDALSQEATSEKSPTCNAGSFISTFRRPCQPGYSPVVHTSRRPTHGLRHLPSSDAEFPLSAGDSDSSDLATCIASDLHIQNVQPFQPGLLHFLPTRHRYMHDELLNYNETAGRSGGQ